MTVPNPLFQALAGAARNWLQDALARGGNAGDTPGYKMIPRRQFTYDPSQDVPTMGPTVGNGLYPNEMRPNWMAPTPGEPLPDYEPPQRNEWSVTPFDPPVFSPQMREWMDRREQAAPTPESPWTEQEMWARGRQAGTTPGIPPEKWDTEFAGPVMGTRPIPPESDTNPYREDVLAAMEQWLTTRGRGAMANISFNDFLNLWLAARTY